MAQVHPAFARANVSDSARRGFVHDLEKSARADLWARQNALILKIEVLIQIWHGWLPVQTVVPQAHGVGSKDCCLMYFKSIRLASLLLGALVSTGHLLAQGSLTPLGAPEPSMKSLDQIEPRTPISSLPFTIDTPGSYYLTGPLSSTNTGITIAANDVTLDLMGFAITGSQDTNYPGIHIAGGMDVMRRNVIVRNGGVTQFGVGIMIENTQVGSVRDLRIYQNVAQGIYLRSNDPGVCTDVTVEDCFITDNGGYGIYGFTAATPANNRNHTIRHNQISGNGARGILLVRTTGCVVDGNTFGPQVPDELGSFAVYTAEGRNMVVRNFESGNTNAFTIAYYRFTGTDTFGPIVNLTGFLPVTNNAVSPWANFSR